MSVLTKLLFADLERSNILKWLNARKVSVIVFLLSLLLFASYAVWNTRVSWLFGDEPHYVIQTISLVKYHTFDLTPTIEGEDYLPFHYAKLEAQSNAGLGGRYSVHAYFFSMLIAPAVAIGLVLGKVQLFVALELALLSALGVVVMYKFIKGVFGIDWVALLTTAIFALSQPLVIYSHLVYPDILEGWGYVLAVYLIYLKELSRRNVTLISFTLAGVFFMHQKTITLTGLLLLWAMWKIFKQHKYRLALLLKDLRVYLLTIPYGLSVLLLLVMNLFLFGKFSFTAMIGDVKTVFTVSPIVGILGNLFDQSHGIIIVMPVFVLVVLGFAALYQKKKELFWGIVITSFIFFIINMTYEDWLGGYSPAPRYMVPLLPVYSVSFAALFINIKKVVSWAIVLLLVGVGTLMTLLLPMAVSYMYVLTETNDLFRGLGGRLHYVIDYWPRFFPPTQKTWIGVAIISVAVLLLSLFIVFVESKRTNVNGVVSGTKE
ncbi:hypothetical protein KC614_00095 [candidate division WWE3 bacterium]|uniref:Uncharacterized protein n=1 Tax=candidate division WWE3 bacterium TaxID=2053526 RepID=A0A955RRJ5_UNCKA|nr:hypothetical protein [candidate division WWE3 bacterium]